MVRGATDDLRKPLDVVVKLPQGRVFQLPVDIERLWEGVEDIGIGPRYISMPRKGTWHLELGGPRNDYASFFYVEVISNPDSVADGRVELIGPEMDELPVESSFPFGFYFKVYGPELTDEHTEYLQRLTQGSVHQEGWGGFGFRSSMWLRVSKAAVQKQSFRKFAQTVRANVMNCCPLVEKMEIKLIIATPEVGDKELIQNLLSEHINPRWDALDAKYKDISDDDVDTFYGCTACQSFAPNHVCIITPNHTPYCGILSYSGAKVECEIDPTGYAFAIPRGKTIDPVMGQYSGVNDTVHLRSHNTVSTVNVYSSIKYPTTNCGCFEAIAFYIPEVDGIGIINRRYTGDSPLGLPFSKMASMVAGGAQNHGFKGVSIRGMRQHNFLAGDAGWDRIVWMPKDTKLEVADVIPEQLYDRIATEDDALDVDMLERFLRENRHPITEKIWQGGKPQPITVPCPGEDWPDE